MQGMDRWLRRFGEHVVHAGDAPRGRACVATGRPPCISDGHVMVRHPDLQTTVKMCNDFGTDVTMYAG